MPPKKPNPSKTVTLDDFTPRTIEQMAPHIDLFPVKPGDRPQDEIFVPFALARETQDGKGERPPRPGDLIGQHDNGA